MRVVNWTEFARLPEGTIYSYYAPAYCQGLHRKGETIHDDDGEPIDYFEASLEPQCMSGGPPAVDDIEGRWGSFEYHQMYAVYEPSDLETVRRMLG